MVGQYEILHVLGEGSYGIVYKAIDKQTGEIIALKRSKEKHHTHSSHTTRTTTHTTHTERTGMREMQILSSLHHPHIIRMITAFHKQQHLYIVSEYMPTNMLHIIEQKMKSGSTMCMSESDVKHYIWQLCLAVSYLHDRGIVHRDLKPENLLVDPTTQTLKLCDFGFARRIHTTQHNNSSNINSCGNGGQFMPSCHAIADMTAYVSTRWYRSPELLLSSRHYNSSVDVWSIGCLVGEMLDGTPVFDGDSEVEMLWMIQRACGPIKHKTNTRKEIQMAAVSPNTETTPTATETDTPQTTTAVQESALSPPNPHALIHRYADKLSPAGLQLLTGMLCTDEEKRLTTRQCLEHEWFADKRETHPAQQQLDKHSSLRLHDVRRSEEQKEQLIGAHSEIKDKHEQEVSLPRLEPFPYTREQRDSDIEQTDLSLTDMQHNKTSTSVIDSPQLAPIPFLSKTQKQQNDNVRIKRRHAAKEGLRSSLPAKSRHHKAVNKKQTNTPQLKPPDKQTHLPLIVAAEAGNSIGTTNTVSEEIVIEEEFVTTALLAQTEQSLLPQTVNIPTEIQQGEDNNNSDKEQTTTEAATIQEPEHQQQSHHLLQSCPSSPAAHSSLPSPKICSTLSAALEETLSPCNEAVVESSSIEHTLAVQSNTHKSSSVPTSPQHSPLSFFLVLPTAPSSDVLQHRTPPHRRQQREEDEDEEEQHVEEMEGNDHDSHKLAPPIHTHLHTQTNPHATTRHSVRRHNTVSNVGTTAMPAISLPARRASYCAHTVTLVPSSIPSLSSLSLSSSTAAGDELEHGESTEEEKEDLLYNCSTSFIPTPSMSRVPRSFQRQMATINNTGTVTTSTATSVQTNNNLSPTHARTTTTLFVTASAAITVNPCHKPTLLAPMDTTDASSLSTETEAEASVQLPVPDKEKQRVKQHQPRQLLLSPLTLSTRLLTFDQTKEEDSEKEIIRDREKDKEREREKDRLHTTHKGLRRKESLSSSFYNDNMSNSQQSIIPLNATDAPSFTLTGHCYKPINPQPASNHLQRHSRRNRLR